MIKIYTRYFLIGFLSFILLFPFGVFVYGYKKSYDILKKGVNYQPNVSTRIFDINGELISELFYENRSIVGIRRIPAHVRQAFICAEDQNFYSHAGMDFLGIARALLVDLFSGSLKQGGSTITQQLVKQLYTKSEKTFSRKIVEVFLTREFEKKYSKNQILEMYLNQVYFGHGVFGVDAASNFYFNKDIDRINVVEAALLAAIPSAPNRYSPLKNMKTAFQRHRQLLHIMVGAGIISREDAVRQFNKFWERFIDDSKIRFHGIGVRIKGADKAPYFTEYVRKILIEKYGEEEAYAGGLRVYTTLDLRCQQVAANALAETIEKQNAVALSQNLSILNGLMHVNLAKAAEIKNISRPKLRHMKDFNRILKEELLDEYLELTQLLGVESVAGLLEKYIDDHERLISSAKVEGAFVALNPQDGGITVMVGGADFDSGNQLNRAVQSYRQPGSAFKIFVYAAGIESGLLSAGSCFLDAPIVLGNSKKSWSPSNYEKTFQGKVLARRAFAASLNIISVLILDRIGTNTVARLASKMIKIPLSRFAIDPTLALGSTELTVLEMAQGVAVIANQGREVRPFGIRYILDRHDRKIFAETSPEKNARIISPETAFIMTSLMREVVDRGTAAGAIRRGEGFTLPAAGKTGTNTDFRDAWFAGFTPDLVAVAWLGCDSQKFTLGRGQSGSSVAAPVWARFMREVYRFRAPSFFRGAPPGISSCRICSRSGDLPAHGCPVLSEYFIAGTQPKNTCNGDHGEMTNIFEQVRKKKEEMREKIKFNLESSEVEISD